MAQLAGQAAFVTGATSGIGFGIASALVAAGARVAIADPDHERLQLVADKLAAAGGEISPVVRGGNSCSWEAAATRVEAHLGPISLICDLNGLRHECADVLPYTVCRWNHPLAARPHGALASAFAPRFAERGTRARIMDARAITGLAAMAMLIPGALSTRVDHTTGVTEAALFGPDRDRAAAESNRPAPTPGAGADELGDALVSALCSTRYLVMTRREWDAAPSFDAALVGSRLRLVSA